MSNQGYNPRFNYVQDRRNKNRNNNNQGYQPRQPYYGGFNFQHQNQQYYQNYSTPTSNHHQQGAKRQKQSPTVPPPQSTPAADEKTKADVIIGNTNAYLPNESDLKNFKNQVLKHPKKLLRCQNKNKLFTKNEVDQKKIYNQRRHNLLG